MMSAGAKKLGWKPFRGPAAINSQPYQGRPGCAYHGYCDRGGCHISAKNSTAVTTIPEAQKTKNLIIFDKAQVTRIANVRLLPFLVPLTFVTLRVNVTDWPGFRMALRKLPLRTAAVTFLRPYR